MRRHSSAGMTIVETVVVIAILGIFMAIAVPSVMKAYRAMKQAERITLRYPNAWHALDTISTTLRRAYPQRVANVAFEGRNDSYEAGGIKIPSDALSFPVFDTAYAAFGSVQKLSYRLERPQDGGVGALVQIRSSIAGDDVEGGVRETLIEGIIGFDISYLDGSVEPEQWVTQWPPVSEPATSQPDRPKAVRMTVLLLQDLALAPTAFSTVVNVPTS